MKDPEATTSPKKDDKQPLREPRGGSKPKKNSILLTVAVLCVIVGAWFLIHWLSKPKAKAPAPSGIPVSAAAVKLGNIDIYLDALGTVTPVYTVTVESRVAGALTEVSYNEGQMVKRNDLLATIDPRPYQALLLQGQGQLARDQAMLKNARLDLVRYQNAFKQNAIPEQQLATQQALVDQDEGVVQLDEGNLAAAQVNVDYTRIVSPIDGRVGLRMVDPGNIVSADGTAALATVTQLQPITVIFTIAEDDLSPVTEQMSTGRTLTVVALDRTKERTIASGTLITIDNQINTTTGTVRARATFPNSKNELFPNQFVNARLLVKTLSQVDLVPDAAIQRNNDNFFVYVIQPDSTVQSRDVKILATEGQVSAISGVKPGDQLVTDGFDKLQSGSKIVVRQPPAAPAAGGNPPAPTAGAKDEPKQNG
jgi:membrane fusion protein, multidrug efflux system